MRSPLIFAYVLVMFVAMVQFVSATISASWYSYAWRTPEHADSTSWLPPEAPRLSFSVIVPARHEETSLPATLSQLIALDHPDFEVIVATGHDDSGTTAVAQQFADQDPSGRISVVVGYHPEKNKPRSLNLALQSCTKEIVVIFDAEDDVAADLLRHADTLFVSRQVDIVQGGVQLMNYEKSWWSLQNVMEYFLWFSSRLHYHAEQQFIPLGGNTVFIRRDLLLQAGGWNEDCLAEDCEIGVRLSVQGARTAVAYSADLATREETPVSLRKFITQRTRWNQGYLQVLKLGHWKKLPTFGDRLMARYLLAAPFFQAIPAVLVPVSALTIVSFKIPVMFVLLAWLPTVPSLTMLTIEVLALRKFGRDFSCRVGAKQYAQLLLMAIPYQLVLSLAAVNALYRQVRGINNWQATAHVNAHRLAVVGGVGTAPRQLGHPAWVEEMRDHDRNAASTSTATSTATAIGD